MIKFHYTIQFTTCCLFFFAPLLSSEKQKNSVTPAVTSNINSTSTTSTQQRCQDWIAILTIWSQIKFNNFASARNTFKEIVTAMHKTRYISHQENGFILHLLYNGAQRYQKIILFHVIQEFSKITGIQEKLPSKVV